MSGSVSLSPCVSLCKKLCKISILNSTSTVCSIHWTNAMRHGLFVLFTFSPHFYRSFPHPVFSASSVCRERLYVFALCATIIGSFKSQISSAAFQLQGFKENTVFVCLNGSSNDIGVFSRALLKTLASRSCRAQDLAFWLHLNPNMGSIGHPSGTFCSTCRCKN